MVLSLDKIEFMDKILENKKLIGIGMAEDFKKYLPGIQQVVDLEKVVNLPDNSRF